MLTSILLAAGILGGAFDLANGAANLHDWMHSHPMGQLAPGSDEWRTACKLNFPNSFDPDTGTWRDMQGTLKKCVCNKAGKCGSRWK